MPDVATAYIVAASEAELVQRLVHRKTESHAALVRRAGTIREESRRIGEFKYVVVNSEGGIERAAQQLSAIVDAERLRTDRP